MRDGMLGEQIVREEQFGLVIQFFKEGGQEGVVEAAGSKDEVPIDLALRIGRRDVTVEEVIEPAWVGVPAQFVGQGPGSSHLEKFGLGFPRGGCRQYADAERIDRKSTRLNSSHLG